MSARLVRALLLALLVAAGACKRSEAPAAAPPPVDAAAAPAEGAPVSPNGDGPAAPSGVLPATFPRDIPIPEGLVTRSVQSERPGSYVALFTGDLEPDAVHELFEKLLLEEGWTIDRSRGAGPEYGLFAEKDDRITTVIATRIDGKLHVELGVYGGD